MASSQESTYTVLCKLSKDSINPSGTSSVTIGAANKRHAGQCQLISSSADEALDLGELSGTLGYIWGYNWDDTNFITIKSGSGGTALCDVDPGESFCFRLPSAVTAPHARADTADCMLEYYIVPD